MGDGPAKNSTTGHSGHWERVYVERRSDEMSWYEASPRISLELIEEATLAADAAIVDIGGGASALAGQLLHRGYTDLTVADISAEALTRARDDLGAEAEAITWVRADVRGHDFGRRFELWHDRALFHFMVEPSDREAYLDTLRRSIARGGHLILATFGPDGPRECSGLPVTRYSVDSLQDALGGEFELRSSRLVDHPTPSGRVQQFIYVHMTEASSART